MKDYLGNNIVKVEDTHPEESRFKPGFEFYDEAGHNILIEWCVRPGSWDEKKIWRCKSKCYWEPIYSETWLNEKRICESCGVWVFNPISGETFEYTDGNPVGVGRPINLKEGLK